MGDFEKISILDEMDEEARARPSLLEETEAAFLDVLKQKKEYLQTLRNLDLQIAQEKDIQTILALNIKREAVLRLYNQWKKEHIGGDE